MSTNTKRSSFLTSSAEIDTQNAGNGVRFLIKGRKTGGRPVCLLDGSDCLPIWAGDTSPGNTENSAQATN